MVHKTTLITSLHILILAFELLALLVILTIRKGNPKKENDVGLDSFWFLNLPQLFPIGNSSQATSE